MTALNADAANAALKRLLLNCITPAMAAETEGLTSISKFINACIERVKVKHQRVRHLLLNALLTGG